MKVGFLTLLRAFPYLSNNTFMGVFVSLWFAALKAHFYSYSTRDLVVLSLSNVLGYYIVIVTWMALFVCF